MLKYKLEHSWILKYIFDGRKNVIYLLGNNEIKREPIQDWAVDCKSDQINFVYGLRYTME